MGQLKIVQGKSQWYLIASQGDMVVRVRPGMALGETASGELSFDPSCAHLTLDIADDGGLVLSPIDAYELEIAEGKRCRREHLPRHRRAEIRLPHNTLQLDTDFVNPAQTDERLEIRAVRASGDSAAPRIGRLPHALPGDPPDIVIAARPPRRTASRSARPEGASTADIPLLDIGEDLSSIRPAVRPASRLPVPYGAPDPGDSVGRRIEGTGARRRRSRGPLLAVLIGLLGIGFLYLALREDDLPSDAATVAGRPGPGAEGSPSAAPSAPSVPVGPTLDAPSIATPASGEEVAEGPAERRPESEPEVSAAIEPIILPPIERRPIPPIAPVPVETVDAAETAADPTTIDRQPDAALLAEAERTVETVQMRVEALARERDLLAADLALVQGRLMAPPEASAYTLYSRVLAQDPDSPEARNGLQSVRQALINRALAQLAGEEVDDARSTLQAAADAGADPMLVANLRREVDYRQRLINAQAGRFDTLYPLDQLVAVRQEPPRLPRGTAAGAEVSVEVQFTVTADGDVSDVAVLDDTPENLEQALRRAVAEWRFEPVLYNGRPIPVRSSVRFTFRG